MALFVIEIQIELSLSPNVVICGPAAIFLIQIPPKSFEEKMFIEDEIAEIKISPSRLYGEVKVSGAKNSVLRLMAASLLTKAQVTIHNYPSTLLDARVHLEMLQALGKSCSITGDELTIEEGAGIKQKLAWEGRSIRNTLLILGALVSRTGYAAVPLPGGCDIGASGERAYDLHVMLLESLGAKVWADNGYLHAEAPDGTLKGCDIHLPIRSTGATENAILAGCLARGITTVWNPHVRPEIIDLITFLKSMGAKIAVFGQERIEIEGVEELNGTHHKVIPDNVEALTWLVGASVTNGEVEIMDFPFEHLEVPLIHLKESGAKFFVGDRSLIVKGSKCYPLEVSTGPYPGINSDMQPILAVYAAKANGQSKFVDLRFPGRYGYARELEKMGLKCHIEGNLLVIDGGSKITGAVVRALDLRAGIALSLAGLFGDEQTEVHDAWQITRGYDQFISKLRSLGGCIEVIR